MSDLILLEPYRSAFLVDGYNCGLVKVVGDGEISQEPMHEVGKSESLQRRVREMALFYPSVQVIHHEHPGQAEDIVKKARTPVLSALGLMQWGIMTTPNIPVDEDRVSRLAKGMKSVEDFWAIEESNLKTWGPLIASQIVARNKLNHPGFFDVLMHHRLRDSASMDDAASRLPAALRRQVPSFLQFANDHQFDLVIFSTLNELLEVDAATQASRCHVALNDSFGEKCTTLTPEVASQMRAVLIERLLEKELRFPIPNSLPELRDIQRREEMVSFRVLFQSWLSELRKLGGEEELRLRKEVRRAMRQFKMAPRLDTAGMLCMVVAAPMGLAGPMGAIGGAVLGLTGMGLDRLSSRWQSESAWVNLCAKSVG
ncbi:MULTISPECIES: hypothetical protein [unclassified Halomonas]|uniref:hypothetical protein n=1 Tax=unclassified Halomonas TaxID=2609666 RepID=UPI0004812E21|nr:MULTISPECIES: hypothetical protein [unclassified Halomonas]PKH59886.1 hypothetical protein CXF94_19780 [Halomonas sp. Choline-3u-9]QGQ70286.1 hypothetical protein FDY98_09955 [Halomonas sp. PA16-9]